MNKILAFSFVILGMISCSKEEVSTSVNSKDHLVFTGEIENSTRTTVDESGKLSWSIDDKITITDASSNVAIYKVISIQSTGRATFEYVSGTDVTAAPFTATYGNVDSQVYDSNNPGTNCPMATESSPTTRLSFHNTCAVLRISAVAPYAAISKIEAAGKTLTFPTAISLSERKYFDLAITPGTYPSGIEIKLTSSNGVTVTKTLSGSRTLAMNELKPIKITDSLPFNMEPLSGIFSVAADKKVQFARANLYWDGTYFKLEKNQYDYRTRPNKIACIDGTRSESGTPADTRGHFLWSKSRNYILADGTTGDVQSNGDYFYFATENTNQIDFPGWSTLTRDEWNYLMFTRTTTFTVPTGSKTSVSSGRIALCCLYSGTYDAKKAVAGLLIFPDSGTWPSEVTTYPNQVNGNGTIGVFNQFWDGKAHYTYDQFKKLQDAGIVFLPIAGVYKDGVTLAGIDNSCTGYYHTSSPSSDSMPNKATRVNFSYSTVSIVNDVRGYGQCIRLVTNYSSSKE